LARKAQQHESIRFFHRQRTQYGLIEQSKNRSIRADAKRERDHGNNRESRRLA
jgi:hypothetical protein